MEIVTRTFEKLLTSKTIDEVERILDDLKIDKKNRMDDQVYPRLKFKITKEEIEELKKRGVITHDNLLTDISTADTLTKLLYSVSWKNGDLKKIKHIIEGIISGQQNEKENGLVFYQFGKYLTKINALFNHVNDSLFILTWFNIFSNCVFNVVFKYKREAKK